MMDTAQVEALSSVLAQYNTGFRKHPRLVKSFEMLGREWTGRSPGEGQPGFGDMAVLELQKALATASGIAGSTVALGDATPIRLENLDGTMTAVLFQESHLKVFASLPRVPSAQPLYQWIREKGYGTERGAAGFREGGAPQVGVSAWERGTILTKYLGVRRGYTHQLLMTGQMGGTLVDPVARENRNGTRQLLAMIERQVVFGDKAIKDADGNEVHYDGIVRQMELSSVAATNIKDLAGRPLNFEDLENAGEQFVTQGKLLNFDMIRTFWKPRVLSDLAKLKLQAERRLMGQDLPEGYRPGTPLNGYHTQHGDFVFDESIFLDPVEDGKPLTDAGDPGSPTAPVAPTTAAAGATAGSKLEAGTYWYAYSSFNDKGESLAVASASGQAAVDTDQITVTGTRTGLSATGFRVYRGTTAVIADMRWIRTIADPGSGTTFTIAVDKNEWRPGHGFGMIINMRDEDVVLAQLAPLIKFPLAIVNTTMEFLLLLYHVLAIKAPERVIVFKNIGLRA